MIDVIARGMIEESNGDISQISEKVNNHTEDSDIHVTTTDKENWNSHPNDITASGNPVQMDGLQEGVPFSELVVSGKNLIPFPYYDTTKTVNGVTYTVNGDGTITMNGTSTDKSYFYFIHDVNAKIYQAGKYTISGMPKNSIIDLRVLNIDDSAVIANDIGNGAGFELTKPAPLRIYLYFGAGKTFDNVIIYPQLELGSTPTAYEPPITGRELTVNVCGKNIIAHPFFIEQQGGTLENNGITYTLNADKSITASGTATADSYCTLQNLTMSPNVNRLKKNTDYFLSGSPVGSGADTYQIYAGIYDNDGNRVEIYHDYGSGVLIRIANDYRCVTSITIKRGQMVSNLIFRPQLELGDTATPYEPYHGSTTTITPDSNPYVIPNDIRQVDGLNVVSVSAGELSVSGVRKNAAIKRIWDGIDEIKTAIIVSNGESE